MKRIKCFFVVATMTLLAMIAVACGPSSTSIPALTIVSTPEPANAPIPTPTAAPLASSAMRESQDPGEKEQSKIPSIVQDIIDKLARGETIDPNDMLPAVDHEGRIQLEFHAAGAVGSTEKADLANLGAIVELSTGDLVWPEGTSSPEGPGIIVAWIPYRQVEAAAALPWVTAVRPVDKAPPDVVP